MYLVQICMEWDSQGRENIAIVEIKNLRKGGIKSQRDFPVV